MTSVKEASARSVVETRMSKSLAATVVMTGAKLTQPGCKTTLSIVQRPPPGRTSLTHSFAFEVVTQVPADVLKSRAWTAH